MLAVPTSTNPPLPPPLQAKPTAPTLRAILGWVASNGPLPAVTGEDASKPRDYWLNLKRLQALHLNGVLFARYTDMSITTGLGQLSNNANTTVKNALVPILKEMDRLDTKVTCCPVAQPAPALAACGPPPLAAVEEHSCPHQLYMLPLLGSGSSSACSAAAITRPSLTGSTTPTAPRRRGLAPSTHRSLASA